MNLYLVKQDVNDGYDTFSAMVVCAINDEDARIIADEHTGGNQFEEFKEILRDKETGYYYPTWAHPKDVAVQCLGTANIETSRGVVLTSYHAG